MSAVEPWYVLGAGAMGSLITLELQSRGLAAHLLHHHRGSDTRRVINGDQEEHLAVQSLEAFRPRSISRLLLTTKAANVGAALSLAQPLLAPNAVIVATANGLGFEREFDTRCRAISLHRAVSTAAAYRAPPDTVHIAAQGLTRIGLPKSPDTAPSWFKDSLALLPGWTWESPIDQALGQKFAINCMINALTAVKRCRNGELLSGESAGPELQALCNESETALTALELWPKNQSLLLACVRVCKDTALNQSSMLQDVLAARETEIAYLNSELLERASALGYTLTLNQSLTEQLSS